MDAAAARREIAGLAAANRIALTRHARERMTQRRISYGDVRGALVRSTSCVAGEPGRWVVVGPDLDDEETRVVCAIEGGVVVITVY